MKTFVSRGGLKLQHAMDTFQIDVTDLTVLDVGSSTGGFVDCLLQNGAGKVYSVDTAYGELAWKLRNDPRVVVMERTNVLHLGEVSKVDKVSKVSKVGKQKKSFDTSDTFDTFPSFDLITIDASWTKLELILPVVQKFLKPDGQIIALLKPHYQAHKKDLIKGVLEKGEALRVKGEVIGKIKELGFDVEKDTESPILGGGGNTEFLLLILPSISSPLTGEG